MRTLALLALTILSACSAPSLPESSEPLASADCESTLLTISAALDRLKAGDAPDPLTLVGGDVRFSTIPVGWFLERDAKSEDVRQIVQDRNGFRLILELRKEPADQGWHGFVRLGEPPKDQWALPGFPWVADRKERAESRSQIRGSGKLRKALAHKELRRQASWPLHGGSVPSLKAVPPVSTHGKAGRTDQWNLPIDLVRRCCTEKGGFVFEESRKIKDLYIVMIAQGSSAMPQTVDDLVTQIKEWYPLYLGLCDRASKLVP